MLESNCAKHTLAAFHLRRSKMAKESIIRKKLAKSLSILEDGLVLIEEEHYLPNTLGTRGFIDILAKDKFGNRVIIELKRSNQAARQALHEIFKYVALFSMYHGLPSHKIRCFIVSTEWSELKVPYSQFIMTTATQTCGYSIDVGSDGSILKAKLVEPLDLSDNIKPFEQHSIYLFCKKADRDNSANKLAEIVKKNGCESYFLINIDYFGKNQAVIHPFGIYLVPLRLQITAQNHFDKKIREEYEMSDDEHVEAELVESEFLTAVSTEAYNKQLANDSFEIGYPEKYVSLKYQGWKSSSIQRNGHFKSNVGMSDDELETLVAGVEGQNPIRFYRVSSPAFKLDWNNVKENIFRALEGNQSWIDAFYWFSGYVEKKLSKSKVSFQIYNPLCLPISLYKFFTTNDDGYLPSLEFVAWDDENKVIHSVIGIIEWDNSIKPDSFKKIISETCEDINQFLMLRHFGEAWLHDDQLMKMHGFHYTLRRNIISAEKNDVSRIIIKKSGDTFDFQNNDKEFDSILSFIEMNAEFADELVTSINKVTVEL